MTDISLYLPAHTVTASPTHRGVYVRANDGCIALWGEERQRRRVVVHRFEAQSHSRRYAAAHIGAAGVDDVECETGAGIYDEYISIRSHSARSHIGSKTVGSQARRYGGEEALRLGSVPRQPPRLHTQTV